MLDGMYAIDGMLDPEGGSLLRSALDALMGPPQRGDGRTTSQRRADALGRWPNVSSMRVSCRSAAVNGRT